MFIDLLGSTALSTKLDLADLCSVIGAYHKCVAETVARFGAERLAAASTLLPMSRASRPGAVSGHARRGGA